jgi:hypothetical protein
MTGMDWLPPGYRFTLQQFDTPKLWFTECSNTPRKILWKCSIVRIFTCDNCAKASDTSPFCYGGGNTADEAIGASRKKLESWIAAAGPWPTVVKK